MTERAGQVGELWRFPVKSMLGESVTALDIGPAGVVGDRAYALVDQQTGKVVSAKHPRWWGGMLECRAAFTDGPSMGTAIPPARITLPDGTTVSTDSAEVHDVLSGFLGRKVRLERSAPEEFTIDQYHPDVPDLDPEGHRDEVVEQPLGAAFFAHAGLPSAVPDGSFFDLFPLSVMTSGTLDRLRALTPGTEVDSRRFRMNVVVDTAERVFVENGWPGQEVALGDLARVSVVMPDPRCVMTTVAQPGLPKATEVLRTLVQHNRLEVAGAGSFPCAGVYAVVATPGRVSLGDPVTVG